MSALNTPRIFLILYFSALVTSGEVTGPVNAAVTLPCVYRIDKYRHSMCWGRGGCPSLACTDEILRTDGYNVTWRKSDRYQLLGDIRQGDVSLTITGATKEDAGTYCCRVEIPGLFNDLTEEIKLTIEEDPGVKAPTTNAEHLVGTTDYRILMEHSRTTEIVTVSLDYESKTNISTANIIRGILILVLPLLFMLIYKGCSL